MAGEEKRPRGKTVSRSLDAPREPVLAAMVGLLRAALADPSEARARLARSLLDPLLAHMLHTREGSAFGEARPADVRIARVLELMESRPEERWTVASLAKAAGMSRAAFARHFFEAVGTPPLQRLTEIRMSLAATRLAASDEGLASIAAEVGYASEFAFSRAWKRMMGEAPGAFRRRCQSGSDWRAPTIRAAA